MTIRRLLQSILRTTWKRPEKCQAIQFGGLEVTALSLLADEFRIGVMPLLGERISIPVVIRMISRLRVSKWAYYQTFIQLTAARVVLVWQETNADAFQLRYHIRIPVFCIQNGMRHNVGPVSGVGFIDALQKISPSTRPTADAYFCFGAAEPSYFGGVIETRFIPHGSLRANAYAKRRMTMPTPVQGLGFIVSFPSRQSIPGESIIGNKSPFLRLGDQFISYEDYYRFDALVATAIRQVSSERGLDFKIIAKRSEETSSEVQFFQDVLGDGVEVLAHVKGEGYELADRFEYLVTVDSAMGYEMRALGKPVAFIANRMKYLGIPCRDLTFGFPLPIDSEGPYWSSAISEPEIRSFLHRWLQSQVHHQIREDVFDLMRLDPGNSQLRGMIRLALAEPR